MGFGKRRKSAAKTRIGDVGLNENDVFHYLFDFGDDWWHRIRVQNIDETKSKKKHIKLIKSVGESPPQYPDYDDDYDEEYEIKNAVNLTVHKTARNSRPMTMALPCIQANDRNLNRSTFGIQCGSGFQPRQMGFRQ